MCILIKKQGLNNMLIAENFENLDKSYQNYSIFKELIVCSNRLINTQHIFQSSIGWSPLVIRRSQSNEVLIWLSTVLPSSNGNEIKYIELIKNNLIQNNDQRVGLDVSSYGFCISLDSTVICEAGDVDENSLEIFKLDLRPIGINIYGDHSKLNFNGSIMSRNTSKNSNSMFGF